MACKWTVLIYFGHKNTTDKTNCLLGWVVVVDPFFFARFLRHINTHSHFQFISKIDLFHFAQKPTNRENVLLRAWLLLAGFSHLLFFRACSCFSYLIPSHRHIRASTHGAIRIQKIARTAKQRMSLKPRNLRRRGAKPTKKKRGAWLNFFFRETHRKQENKTNLYFRCGYHILI